MAVVFFTSVLATVFLVLSLPVVAAFFAAVFFAVAIIFSFVGLYKAQFAIGTQGVILCDVEGFNATRMKSAPCHQICKSC